VSFPLRFYRNINKRFVFLKTKAAMEPSSGSSRFRMSEGDWICSDPQYAATFGLIFYL
jgi:hypothetical protein